MAITWIEGADSRQNLGDSGIIQQNTATFSASDYVPGGYPVYAGAFGLSSIRGLWPVSYSANGAGFPGGYVWEYIKPAVAGPAATNPGYLKAFQQNGSTGPLVEVSVSSNFAGGNADFIAFGY